jgi:hypothetical protein
VYRFPLKLPVQLRRTFLTLPLPHEGHLVILSIVIFSYSALLDEIGKTWNRSQTRTTTRSSEKLGSGLFGLLPKSIFFVQKVEPVGIMLLIESR